MYKHLSVLFLAVLVHASAFGQSPTTFTFQGDLVQDYTVPATGWYCLDASGAQGGPASNGSHQGGKGARMQGGVFLQAGDNLLIAVGGAGQGGQNDGNNVSGGGGGGGSSIVKDNGDGTHELLLIAGGGGGAAANYNGSPGLLTQDGGPPAGGTDGSGGGIGSNFYGGAGGGGYYGGGGTHYDNDGSTVLSQGGSAYPDGNYGGASTSIGGWGGWGGGGQGGPAKSAFLNNHDGGGGGGGGYSGGGGGANEGDGGGGGGSYASPTTNTCLCQLVPSVNDGDGVVTIAPSSPTIDYELPADIPVTTSDASDSTFQEFGWRSFLGLNAPGVGEQISTIGDNVPQWATWSSTVDLIICQQSPTPDGCRCSDGGCDRSGTRFYPSACRQIPDFENYRVLGQVNKADDSFEEAGGDKGKPGSLSGAPVIDRFGNFLRYEILVSPATYDEIISEQLYDQQRVMNRNSDINMSCGTSNYTGGDPANAQMGALVVKVAWMDVTDALASGEIDPSRYHLEQVLVSTPFYRNSDGEATCDVRTMAMVGLHLAHKTTNQPNWIWSTFEHNLNAPDCTGSMGAVDPRLGSQNTTCPDSVSVNYNFYGQACSGGAPSCASCNAAPSANGSCANPASSEGAGFCLDLPPAATAGISKLCRQVPISGYPEAGTWNSSCQAALGSASVWSNYELISSQWATSEIAGGGCNNVARKIATKNLVKGVEHTQLRPHAPDRFGPDGYPVLGNTAMESYERSNCLGCHAKAQYTGSNGNTYSTDLIYFLHLEVSAPAAQTAKYEDEIASGGDSAGGGGDGCQVAAPHDGNPAWLLLLPAALLLWRRRSR